MLSSKELRVQLKKKLEGLGFEVTHVDPGRCVDGQPFLEVTATTPERKRLETYRVMLKDNMKAMGWKDDTADRLAAIVREWSRG